MTLCGQTKLQLPHWMHASGSQSRDEVGDPALLVGRGAARERAVDRQGAHREGVAAAGHHLGGHGADELGRVGGHDVGQLALRGAGAPGTGTSCSAASVASTAASLRRTTSAPRRP